MDRKKKLIGLLLAGTALTAALQWVIFPAIRERQTEAEAKALTQRSAPPAAISPTSQPVPPAPDSNDLWLILLPREIGNLSFRAATMSEPKPREGFQTYAFRLSVVSDYGPLVSYLNHLERSDPKVVVSNMLTVPEAGNPRELLTKLQGVIYVPQ